MNQKLLFQESKCWKNQIIRGCWRWRFSTCLSCRWRRRWCWGWPWVCLRVWGWARSSSSHSTSDDARTLSITPENQKVVTSQKVNRKVKSNSFISGRLERYFVAMEWWWSYFPNDGGAMVFENSHHRWFLVGSTIGNDGFSMIFQFWGPMKKKRLFCDKLKFTTNCR